MSKKFVYMFSEGDASMRNLLGGKGANLAEMRKFTLCAHVLLVTKPVNANKKRCLFLIFLS